MQAWYQGGVSVMDFTDPAQPFEIAYFDRGPIDPKVLVLGGEWSAYWYNGTIYANDITRGVDAFNLLSSVSSGAATWSHLNAQTQENLTAFPISRPDIG